jgi:four helix bundle protein
VGKVTRFEELIAWQKARELTRSIYEATHHGAFGRDYDLSRQVQRAAVLIMSNIAGGFERAGRGEFHHFLSTAKASCAEVRSQLYVALDVGYLDKVSFDRLMQQAEEVSRIMGGLRASVQRQKEDGN